VITPNSNPLNLTLTHKRMAAYSCPEMTLSAIEFTIQLFLLDFYVRVVGLNPALAGIALGIGIIWSIVLDPFCGFLSDRTHSRLGQRIPYLMMGGLLLSVSLIPLFNPLFSFEYQSTRMLYLLVSYIFVNTSMTLIAVPHITVAGELSSHQATRTYLFSWRFLFANIGLLIAIAVPWLLTPSAQGKGLSTNGSILQGQSSVIYSITLVLTTLICVTSLIQWHKRPYRALKMPEFGNRLNAFMSEIGTTFRHIAFRVLILSAFIAGIGQALNTFFSIFYYRDALKLSSKTDYTLILLVFIVATISSIPLWLKLSHRFSKKICFSTALGILGIMTFFIYPQLPEKNILAPIAVALIAGLLSGSLFLLESFVADCADLHEAHCGIHRSGIYFGVWKMIGKLSRAITFVFSGILLHLLGYQSATDSGIQSAHTIDGLRILFGPIIGTLFMLSAISFFFIPLTPLKMDRIRKIIQRRRARPEYHR
jgi:GPH family glycoside/pentoside/hexuronide:cation symporter